MRIGILMNTQHRLAGTESSACQAADAFVIVKFVAIRIDSQRHYAPHYFTKTLSR